MNITKLIQALIEAFPILEKIFNAIREAIQRKQQKQSMVDYKKAEEKARNSDNTEDLQEIIGRKLK